MHFFSAKIRLGGPQTDLSLRKAGPDLDVDVPALHDDQRPHAVELAGPVGAAGRGRGRSVLGRAKNVEGWCFGPHFFSTVKGGGEANIKCV